MPTAIDWQKAIQPLLKKYKKEKHPLQYKNTYQLVIMVILAAQDSDKHINQLAPDIFKVIPNMKALAAITPSALQPLLAKIRNGRNKTNWLLDIGKKIKKDSDIPKDIDGLVELSGIGRKSANVILRESGLPAQGVMVDLHTVRVAPRLGIASGSDPKKIEQQIMEILPQKEWDAGMCMSFLGREICRPDPKCEICLMTKVCKYYHEVVKGKSKKS